MENEIRDNKKKGSRTALNLSSLLYIALGVFLLVYSDQALRMVCIGIGTVTLVYGIIRLISYFSMKRAGFLASVDLGVGIIMTGIGIVLTITPDFVISIIPFFVGLVILVQSISKISQALELRDVEYDNWWWMLLVSLLMLLLGAYIVFNPFETVALMVRAVGFVLIINGVLSIIGTIYTKVVVKKYRKVDEASCKDAETGEELEVDIIDVDGTVIK